MKVNDSDFSVRDFLKSRNALLVHFSTPMSRHENLTFPNDLNNAITLKEIPLSFSTILPGDKGPYHPHISKPEDANAVGCIGILVDIENNSCVEKVLGFDAGSYFDPVTETYQADGSPPSLSACEDSIDNRNGVNEWYVKNYVVIGIFVVHPIFVRKNQVFHDGIDNVEILGEVRISIDEALMHFPTHRFITADSGQFFEYSRENKKWNPVLYDSILS
jgi:hypothetical protein